MFSMILLRDRGGMPRSNGCIMTRHPGHGLSEHEVRIDFEKNPDFPPSDRGCPGGIATIGGVQKLIPTHHAVKRAKKRTGWCRHTLERMLKRVHSGGIGACDCSGSLKDYLEAVGFSEGAPVIRQPLSSTVGGRCHSRISP